MPPPTTTTLVEIGAAYWPVLLASFAVSFLLTPLCRSFALRRGIVDRPDDFLKPHKKPIPYLGGVAIFLGWAAGVLVALILFGRIEVDPTIAHARPIVDLRMLGAILVAGSIIVTLGLFDDLRLLSPKLKLLVTSAVTIGLIAFGVGNDTMLIVVRSMDVNLAEFPRWLLVAYSVPVTLFITVGASNATNLIDGVDGLCSGVLGIISAGFLVLAVHLQVWHDWNALDASRVVLSLAMMGAALGFLPYNRNPATIFMGDAGSMLLGLNAAIILLLFAKSEALRWLLGSMMAFGLPLADMALAVVRRWRNGKPLMIGDRSHFYDQLIDRGLPVRRVVTISYALAAAFCILGCLPIALRTRYIIPLYFAVSLAVIWAIARFDMVRIEPRDSRPEGRHDS